MKIFLICSKKFYSRIPEIQKGLEIGHHTITLPNTYDDPTAEERYLKLAAKKHAEWKTGMFNRSRAMIEKNDAVLVLNFEKDGIKNYIGGATFIEIYDAYRMGKKIFLFNEIPNGILRDEISSFSPIVLNGDLDKIK